MAAAGFCCAANAFARCVNSIGTSSSPANNEEHLSARGGGTAINANQCWSLSRELPNEVCIASGWRSRKASPHPPSFGPSGPLPSYRPVRLAGQAGYGKARQELTNARRTIRETMEWQPVEADASKFACHVHMHLQIAALQVTAQCDAKSCLCRLCLHMRKHIGHHRLTRHGICCLRRAQKQGHRAAGCRAHTEAFSLPNSFSAAVMARATNERCPGMPIPAKSWQSAKCGRR